MNAPASNSIDTRHALEKAVVAACDAIAPTWPLDQMIAVNPYWGRIAQPFDRAAASLATLGGSPLTMPLAYYRERWQSGAIGRDHLRRALDDNPRGFTEQQALAALDADDALLVPAPLLCDSLDRQRDLRHEPAWCDTITHQIGQFCAAWFDQGQADWHPDRTQALYASWRQTLARDHSVALLMKAPHIPRKAQMLAEDAHTQLQRALTQLEVEPGQWPQFLQAILMRVSGWAAWCAYRRWQARLAGGDDHTLVDLLAIRLTWECLLDDGERRRGSPWQHWQQAWGEHFQRDGEAALPARLLWQRAHEISYQQQLSEKLGAAPGSAVTEAPAVQAVFCIDVRSEVLRRHLEAQSPAIQTRGFAGFFGIPISYTPLGTGATRPQLPGLLAPAIAVSDSSGDADRDQQVAQARQQRLRQTAAGRAFQLMPGSSFTLVETLGLGYVAKLLRRSLPGTDAVRSGDTLGLSEADSACLRPDLKAALAQDPEQQVEIAARALTGMGLTGALAPLVLLVGHGSQSQNNPQRAGLDCGACCGQSGEVNARALAGLLNDSAVREGLGRRGIAIPARTQFVAALHNTTTDDVRVFDGDSVPASHRDALAQLTAQLTAAGIAARAERAPALGLADCAGQPDKLARRLRRRANDWAQTRPEWGLANNAAFIVAPRWRTRGIDMAGRSFLHDYDHRQDSDHSLLELIMTAPMVVTHWINMQYHASTVDNRRYGSGNKTLHNVVGGRLGVFEGNGGDLRIGLAKQSVHDGDDWRHEPLRLSVVIDAPRAAIEAVIARHETVRHLVHNQWLYLARFADEGLEWYRGGQWCR